MTARDPDRPVNINSMVLGSGISVMKTPTVPFADDEKVTTQFELAVVNNVLPIENVDVDRSPKSPNSVPLGLFHEKTTPLAFGPSVSPPPPLKFTPLMLKPFKFNVTSVKLVIVADPAKPVEDGALDRLRVAISMPVACAKRGMQQSTHIKAHLRIVKPPRLKDQRCVRTIPNHRRNRTARVYEFRLKASIARKLQRGKFFSLNRAGWAETRR